MSSDITLRPLTALDGEAVAALAAQSKSTTKGWVQAHVQTHPELAAHVLANGAEGVAAEATERPGLVGMIWMQPGECWVEGARLPYAYINGKVVHPDFRRRGIGLQLSGRLLARIEELLGADCMILASISMNNSASLASARKFGLQPMDGRALKFAFGMRQRPPRPPAGVEVRPAELGDLEEFLARESEQLGEHNLFPARTIEQFARRLSPGRFGRALSECLVAVGRRGRMLAGLLMNEVGRLSPVRVESANPVIGAGGVLLGVIPPDGLIRPIRVSEFWFSEGNEAAAMYLWEMARWLWRDRGTMMNLTVDPRSPAARLMRPGWLRRPMAVALVVDGPVRLSEARPTYVQHV